MTARSYVMPAVACVCAVLLSLAACRGPDEVKPNGSVDDAALAADLAGPRDLGSDLRSPDLARVNADLAMAWPAPMPPPASCNMRNPGVTAMQIVVRIDEYKGLQTGRNGVHELAESTVLHTSWVYDKTVVDTSNVHLAMNVASVTDPAGLPMELPLTVGQIIEVEGEYIPAATAKYTNKSGPAAVVHFTHMPCGYAVISGKTYN